MAGSSPDWRMRSPSVDGRDNTTRPSEDLRAQVAMVQPAGSHAVADYQSVGGIVEGRSKRSIRSGAWLGRP